MPPKKRQTNTRRELVSAEILERAAALFAAKGFASTSLQDVAESLKISRTALYHYISSKEELLEQLVHGLTEDTAASLERLAADESLEPVERLEAAVRDMATRIAHNPARFRLLAISESDLPEPIATQHLEARRRTLRALVAIVRAGMVAGSLRPVDERVAALSLLGMCNWLAWWYNPGHPEARTPEQLVDDVTSLGVAALESSRGEAPRGGGGGVEHAVGLLRQDLDYLERALSENG